MRCLPVQYGGQIAITTAEVRDLSRVVKMLAGQIAKILQPGN